MSLIRSGIRLTAQLRLLALAGFALAGCTIGPVDHPAPTAAETKIIAIDVVLEPDVALVETAREVNSRLKAGYPDGYSLDATHAPHVSLMQRYVREGDLKAISSALAGTIKRERPQHMTLSAQRYLAAPWGDLKIMVLLVERTAELDRLQAAVAKDVEPYAVNGGDRTAFALDASGEMDEATIAFVEQFVPKWSGANYRPHITVGVAPEPVMKSIEAEPFKPQSFRPKRVAIYQLGRFGTAQKLLWSSNQR